MWCMKCSAHIPSPIAHTAWETNTDALCGVMLTTTCWLILEGIIPVEKMVLRGR